MQRAIFSVLFSIFLFATVLFFSLLANPALAATAPALLPQTGQTTCYDAAGTVITCAGTGQDGETRAGVAWPIPRFVDNGDQTQTDKLTGLIWSKDANPAGTAKTWQGALDYIKSLNSQNYQGHNDWRLPNINELKSIINQGQPSSIVWLNDQGFTGFQSSVYWSSSSLANNTDLAWNVYMNDGFVDYDYKSNSNYLWPVRTGQFGSLILPQTGQAACYDTSGATIVCNGTGQDGELQTGAHWPTPRFVANSDQTVTDAATGLVWSKDANPAAATKTWQDALDYIKNLNSSNHLGHSDWRLPNFNELQSLINHGQSSPAVWLNGQGFAGVQSVYYWSSGSFGRSTDYAWVVYMYGGHVGISNKGDNGYVWPVRSEQSGSFGSLVLSIIKSGTGGGTVTSSTGSINCGSTCSANTTTGTAVTLTATPDSGSSFAGWSGACNGASACNLTMDAAKGVGAVFNLVATPVNGVCGSSNGQAQDTAPAANLCTVGTASTVSGSGPWNWNCAGLFGGTNSPNCSAPVKIYTIPVTVTGGNGTVSCTVPTYNGTSTCTVTPVNGYQLATFTDNGVDKKTAVLSGSYVISNVTAIHSIEASFVFQTSTGATPALLPQTGQTTCYDSTGTSISCAGTGQDGETQAGAAWPNPRFVDNGDQTQTDKLTGLVWSKDANPAGVSTTWQGALDYIKNLNSSNYLGHNNWRLPNINELRSLINLGSHTKIWLESQGFVNVLGSNNRNNYWSSTTVFTSNNAFSAQSVNMEFSYVNSDLKWDSVFVWPVRTGNSGVLNIFKTGQTKCYNAAGAEISCIGTGQDGELQVGLTWPTPRFSVGTDQTVTDKLTWLIWVNDGNIMATRDPSFDMDGDKDGLVSWQRALDYIKKLNTDKYLGYNDWRLPNREELASLANFSKNDLSWLNSEGFSHVKSAYWSSSTEFHNLPKAWFVSNGWSETLLKSYYSDLSASFVLPVRGGLPMSSSGSLTLSVSKSGTGSGMVTSSTGGISCGATCSAAFDSGTSVTLTASPDNGSSFAEWSGACSGIADCTVTVDAAKTVTVTFNATVIPVNGTCGSSNGGSFTVIPAAGLCTSGIATTVTGSGPWNWMCQGGNGGTTASCQATKTITMCSTVYMPACGVDGKTYSNDCYASAASVSIARQGECTVAVNASCGSASGTTATAIPVTNLCATGTASSVTGSGPWNWKCSGYNGGTEASCSATLPSITIPVTVTGGNGTVTCTVPVYKGTSSCTITPISGYQLATLSDNGVDVTSTVSGATYSINNVTANHSIAATFAIIAVPVNGTCGSSNGGVFYLLPTANLCSSGTASTVTGNAPWSWNCSGSNGGTTQSCTAQRSVLSIDTISKLPKTGQTSCSDEAGTTLSCAGTGQDAELQMGVVWPSPRFGDNGDQTQTDKLTGLIWSKDAYPAAGNKTWQGALDFIKTLNSGRYLGYNDWRLPNINELATLINRQQDSNATWLTGQGFSNVQSSKYWSGSSVVNNTGSAWNMTMNDSSEGSSYKTYTFAVWPVRGGQSGANGSLVLPVTGQTACYDTSGASINCNGTGQDGELQSGAAWPVPRFVANADQTITDALTGVVWSKDAKSVAAAKTWQDALDYIKILNSGRYLGYSDWRLPNISELASLINRQQSSSAAWLNGQGFVNVQSGYWSGSSFTYSADNAWYVVMNNGNVSKYDPKTFKYYVWPVRSGQSGSFGSLTLAVNKTGVGNGTIAANSGILTWAGKSGTATYSGGTSVTLTATADNGSAFGGWSGCNSTSGNRCNVTLSAAKNVTAYFVLDAQTGVCGAANGQTFNTAPTVDLCSVGTVGAITGNNPLTWSCVGAGGSASCSANIIIVPPPTLNISTLPDGAITHSASSNISGTVSSSVGIVGLKINNSSVTFANDAFSSLLTLKEGANTITVVAVDTLGASVTDTRVVTLDSASPVLTVSTPADNSKTAQAVVAITGTVDEASLVTVSVNNGSPQAATMTGTAFSASANLSSGINTVIIVATDSTGKSSMVKRTITFNNSAPSLSITNPNQDTSTTESSITISGTVTDVVSSATITITANGQNYTPTVARDGSFSQSVPLPSDKTYSVVVTATDLVGNTGSVQRNIIKTTPLTQPTIADALKVFQAVVGLNQLNASEQLRYDVAPLSASGTPLGNGVIDAADVILILRRSIGIGSW